jgi:hypothetical protein
MKKIDFSQPGKMPLTQDRLKYLQDAYTEALVGLASVFKSGTTPICLTGIVSTGTGISTSVSVGWFLYNGELIRFTGGGYGPVMVGDGPYIVISQSASPLTYHDGTTPNVVLDKTASLAILPGTTPTDATHFPLSNLKPAAVALAEESENDIYTPYINPTYAGFFVPDAVSPIKYRKSIGSKTVTIKGVTADPVAVSIVSNFTIFILPAGYRPTQEQVFPAFNRLVGCVPIRVKTTGEVALAGDLLGQPTDGCWLNISFDVD